MTGKTLDQYRGPLTAAQSADGINAAIRTARSLAADARLLFDNGRFATAASLAILSMEESGKIGILRQFSIAEQGDWHRIWKQYRSHTKKNRLAGVVDYVHKGANKLPDFLGLFQDDAEHAYLFDQVKQLGFYSDCLGAVNWSEPVKVVDEKLAAFLVIQAESLAQADFVSAKEIELWTKHFKAVAKSDIPGLYAALENWYEDMQRHGLAPQGENRMRRFVREGFGEQPLDGHK